MIENGPTTSGQYVDRGPRIEGTKVSIPSTYRETIRQGRERPRPLTLAETEKVARNRKIARDDLMAMEVWYRANCKSEKKARALNAPGTLMPGRTVWLERHPGGVRKAARRPHFRSERWR